jgi:hypothetical protein
MLTSTEMLNRLHDECQGIQEVAGRSQLHLRNREGWLWPSDRSTGNYKSELPMHGQGKELGTGLVNAIKKQLGLK